ncbi:Beta-glucanase [Glycine soja]|uniref:Beta-glucanase n=1 Tax=Glycine soja TaxID=3848 RepID=A0A445L6F3_GLYSO|nr:Beta-glucanase [Glycine soja]
MRSKVCFDGSNSHWEMYLDTIEIPPLVKQNSSISMKQKERIEGRKRKRSNTLPKPVPTAPPPTPSPSPTTTAAACDGAPPTRFNSGTLSALIRCPSGDTSGLNFNLYLSSLEGNKSQDEIDFEFLGRDRNIVQTNYFSEGVGNMEKVHVLGFDASDGFHEYGIVWGSDAIEWRVDGNLVRRLCFCTLRCGMQVGLMKGSGVGSTVGLLLLNESLHFLFVVGNFTLCVVSV